VGLPMSCGEPKCKPRFHCLFLSTNGAMQLTERRLPCRPIRPDRASAPLAIPAESHEIRRSPIKSHQTYQTLNNDQELAALPKGTLVLFRICETGTTSKSQKFNILLSPIDHHDISSG
jgi:hypothetical protein